VVSLGQDCSGSGGPPLSRRSCVPRSNKIPPRPFCFSAWPAVISRGFPPPRELLLQNAKDERKFSAAPATAVLIAALCFGCGSESACGSRVPVGHGSICPGEI